MPHSELPYAEGEEFLEVMSRDRGAGLRPVEEGGSLSSGGPEDVEGECASEKACGTIGPSSGGPGRARSQRACGVQDLVSRVLRRM